MNPNLDQKRALVVRLRSGFSRGREGMGVGQESSISLLLLLLLLLLSKLVFNASLAPSLSSRSAFSRRTAPTRFTPAFLASSFTPAFLASSSSEAIRVAVTLGVDLSEKKKTGETLKNETTAASTVPSTVPLSLRQVCSITILKIIINFWKIQLIY